MLDAGLATRLFFVVSLVMALSSCATAARLVLHEQSGLPFSGTLKDRFDAAGFEVRAAGNAELAEAVASRPDLVVLPDARRVPAVAVEALASYMRSGGRLLAVGAPAFSELLVEYEGNWQTVKEALERVRQKPPDRILFQFRPGDEKLWTRSTNHPEFEERLSVFEGALAGFVADIDGWNTYDAPPLEDPFAGGHTLTVFEAMGDANTPRLWLEWREKDGSRWMAEVPLQERWNRYVLQPSDFRFWADGAPPGRGGPGDRFNPDNAASLHIGLAENFGRLPRGRHIWWVRNIGVSRSPVLAEGKELPRLETFSPAYKTYPMRDVHKISARSDQSVLDRTFALEGVFHGAMPVWRPRGLGAVPGNQPPMRFIPLVDAFDHHGHWRGSAAWLLLNFEGEFAGSALACIGLDPSTLQNDAIGRLADLAVRMAGRFFDTPFLRNGGATIFAARPGDALQLGASAFNLASGQARVSAAFSLVQEGKERPLARSGEQALPPGGAAVWEGLSAGLEAMPGPARLVTRLYANDRIVDEISQPITVRSDQQAKDFVRVENGQFVYRGEAFFANGVNYWPRSSIGLEPASNNQHLGWLLPWSYDPEVVERDLVELEALRVNLLSVQYTDPQMAPQMVDFLERCRTHRIFVNVFVAGANPLGPDLDLLRHLVLQANLPESDRIFAYDLAWEPNLGREDNRAQWDPAWREWLEEQYGSVKQAERIWGHPVRRDAAGQPTGPSDEQLTTDGPWRPMVAAYRRFADDLISRGYGRVTRFLRRLDPVHLFGVRTGYGGTGQMWPVAAFPFDLASGVAHLDFTSPEGYGLQGETDNFLAAGFTTEYGRFVSGGKPVFWAEYGVSVWPDTESEDRLQRQKELFENNYRLFTRSHANGAAAWWYPGGYRVDEKSDYGIMRQDVTPRPAALVLRDWYPKASASLQPEDVAGTILIDRDRHVTGYAGVWREARDEYLAALKRGRRLVPRTAGTGTDSATCPDDGIGGGLWAEGAPPKYMNAEFGAVQFALGGGGWQDWEGGLLRTGRGQEVRLRLEALNTGEARWLGRNGRGCVSLLVSWGDRRIRVPLGDDVAPLKSRMLPEVNLGAIEAETLVELRMTCEGRGAFGQRLRIIIQPDR
ncbi:MAG: hypothetical protein KatS3mg024_1837 [Armatimonadota bacterium]|nr:MAG: hypothetical protein KatS3mg024_1837 [Armatimonadota bacterium]